MAKTPNPNDVLKLGQEVATIKANMPAKRWAKFVKLAHDRGHTISGELRGGPDALKERTAASLKAEAQKNIADAYAPATKALSTREAAIGYLDEKRKADDASYRTWLTGETEKLNAQAAAADATLSTQQTNIAQETAAAIKAARADSLARVSQAAGNVSDPRQSAALDTTAADEVATKHVAAAREQTAALNKIGADSRSLSTTSLLAQQGAREATRAGDTLKARSELESDRTKMLSEQAAATVAKIDDLVKNNQSIAQANRESDLAGASLGLKQQDAAQAVLDANRKYKLEQAKFGLDKWKAENADVVARAKVDLGYDEIKSREGVAAARRKLDEKLTKIRAAGKAKSKGVTQDERDLYRGVDTVRGLFLRWDKNNAVPLAERDQHLRDMGYDDATINAARDLARNDNTPSTSTRALLRKIGIKHTGYFWPPVQTPYDDRARG